MRFFDRCDLGHLASQRSRVPGADESTLTVGVSRTDFDVEDLDVNLTPKSSCLRGHSLILEPFRTNLDRP